MRGSNRKADRTAPQAGFHTWNLTGILRVLLLLLGLTGVAGAVQGDDGSMKGLVLDREFGDTLAGVRVEVVERGQTVESGEDGMYRFPTLPPGRYTVIFSKAGYLREIQTNVLIAPGQVRDLDVTLAGEFAEMEEFVVQDVLAGATSTEAGLLTLRMDSPAVMDSISADLMARGGASTAADGLRLVAGATVSDGKFAVIRGLPDRYVSSQLNGVRLPSADEETRAVELDQFPSAVIDSIQVSKTFTPDQQGDASGGAVDVRLKGIPDETTFSIKGQVGGNSNVWGTDEFLTYEGGGVNTWGRGLDERAPQPTGQDWTGAVGVTPEGPPRPDYKLSTAGGGKFELTDGVTVGGFASFFYNRDNDFYDDGRSEDWWVDTPGQGLVPQEIQGTASDGDFKTKIYDVTQGTQRVQWGGLLTGGVEWEDNLVQVSYLYSHSATDKATLALNTRGKEYYFPGYDPNDPTAPGNTPDTNAASPYIRLETLEYTERTNSSLQFNGEHVLPFGEWELGSALQFQRPKLSWGYAVSSAQLVQPDKRQFGALWRAPSFNPGVPPFVPPFTTDPEWFPFKPAANFTLGNLQRIYKSIKETSDQYHVDLEFPFEQWDDQQGSFKFGLFDDSVKRTFDQDTFSNFNDAAASFVGDFGTPWSDVFPGETHPVTASTQDVDYRGNIDVSAVYGMVDMPLAEQLTLIGGMRFESTDIQVRNEPEEDALWYPLGSNAPVALDPPEQADVDFSQDNSLPAIGLNYEPTDDIIVRLAFSETIARQTFRELTPIIQQEFLGAPIFIGNPELGMSSLKNYDLRVDWTPYTGGLLSASYFYKDIKDPIEYVQRLATFSFTSPTNYPSGTLSGFEVEARHDMGRTLEALEGLSLGANATFIESEVLIPEDEQALFDSPAVQAPRTTRDMTNAPEHLYNLYVTYELAATNTRLGLFYTVQGDTLKAGAGVDSGNLVPDVYQTEYGTLNFSLRQAITSNINLEFQAKNLTNPEIQTVYRSEYIASDQVRTTFTRGIDVSLAISASWGF